MNFPERGVLVEREIELAWAAGFFDGEGTTSCLRARRDKYIYIRMSIAQKFPELLEKFRDIVGYGKVYSNSRGMYSWDCYKQSDVPKVLTLLWPYLSEIKKKQARIAKLKVEERRSSCGV